MNLNGEVGNSTHVALLAGLEQDVVRKGIVLTPGQGLVPRGAVLVEASGFWNWAEIAGVTEAANVAILELDTDAGTDTTGAGAPTTACFTGLFCMNALAFKTAAPMTSAAQEILRHKGMHMDHAVPVDGAEAIFTNNKA